jgi:hypothetical protein
MGLIKTMLDKLKNDRNQVGAGYSDVIRLVAAADAGDGDALAQLAKSLGIVGEEHRLSELLAALAGKLDISEDDLERDIDAAREAIELAVNSPTEDAMRQADSELGTAGARLKQVAQENESRLAEADSAFNRARIHQSQLSDTARQAKVRIAQLQKERPRAFGLEAPAKPSQPSRELVSQTFAPPPKPEVVPPKAPWHGGRPLITQTSPGSPAVPVQGAGAL